MNNRLQVRMALGIAAACSTAVGLYGVLRVVQFYLFPDANPALVIWSAHAGYFWRSWTVGYVGGMAGLLAFGAAGRNPVKVARVLVPTLTLAALILAAQGLFVP